VGTPAALAAGRAESTVKIMAIVVAIAVTIVSAMTFPARSFQR
jgi:hypothetical protein